MNTIYTELFKRKFKTLGFFCDELFAEPDKLYFFRNISENIVPLLNQSPVFDPLLSKWRNEKKMHKEQESILQSNYNQAVHESIEFLDSIHVATEPQILDFVSMLKLNPEILRFPTNTTSDFKSMLNNLGKIGQEKCTRIEVSIAAINQHNNVFSWDMVMHAWVAYEFLNHMRWCWHISIPLDQYERLKECKENDHLILYRPYLEEIEFIKIRQNYKYTNFFTVERFKRCIKLINEDILLYQEIGIGSIKSSPVSKNTYPYSVEPFIEDNRLYLNVLWDKDGPEEKYLVHSFHTPNNQNDLQSSGNQKFMDEAINKPGTKIYSDKSCSLGFTTAKFLERTKLKGPLAKILFSECTTTYVVLRNKKVIIADIKDVKKCELLKLKSQIKAFEKVPILPNAHF